MEKSVGENEVWLELPECDGRYDVSNLGRILYKKPKSGKPYILPQHKSSLGYCQVCLRFNNLPHKNYLVHRIVARMFVANPRNLNEINHKDGNKENNRADNLEWCTRSENILHAFATGLKKNLKGADHPSSKVVYQYDLQGNFIKKWGCINEACEAIGADHTNISYACSGKIKTCMGYIWSYEYREIDPTKHERELNGNLVYQYTKTGELVATYKTAHEANRATGNDFSLICACCRGTRMSTGGYVWSYVPLERTSDRFKRHLGNGSKKVYQYTLNGEFVAEYDNLTIAEEQTCIDKRLISSCATGKKKKARGYIWRYEKI